MRPIQKKMFLVRRSIPQIMIRSTGSPSSRIHWKRFSFSEDYNEKKENHYLYTSYPVVMTSYRYHRDHLLLRPHRSVMGRAIVFNYVAPFLINGRVMLLFDSYSDIYVLWKELLYMPMEHKKALLQEQKEITDKIKSVLFARPRWKYMSALDIFEFLRLSK